MDTPAVTEKNKIDFNDAPPQCLVTLKPEGRITADELKKRLHERLLDALYYLFPEGKVAHKKFLIGNIHGHAGESLTVELSGDKVGLWHDFATGEGGDILSLWGATHGWDNRRHFREITIAVQEWLGAPQSPLLQRDTVTETRVSEAQVSEARTPETQTPTPEPLGTLTGKWNYENADGDNIIASVYRFDTPDGGKEYRPWDVKAKKWQVPDPRPLYNQPGIARSDTVVLVEGEKCAAALIALGICATTAMNGANAPVDKTDWSPLIGKHVVIWPDNDNPGREYGDKVVNKLSGLGVLSLALMDIPEGKPEKWDVMDAIDEGRDIRALMDSCARGVLPSIGGRPSTDKLPAFTAGQLVDDATPFPEDLVAPRILTSGGLLVFGGAPKVGKTDLLLSWLAYMAAGLPFLGMMPPRPLKIFYLQTEIMYDYLRERLRTLSFDPNFFPLVRQNLVITPQVRLLLNEEGVTRVYNTIAHFFNPKEVDLIVIDPLRNVYDPGKSGSENDNTAMLAFLQDRVEKLRYLVNSNAGVILTHHTKKITKKMVEEDPFQALSGAASLRSFYTTGLLLFRSDEQKSIRQIIFELRNGKGIPMKWVDKIDGRWREMHLHSERTIRKDYGQKLDAERKRCHDVILQMIFDEARKGNLYMPSEFCRTFESQAGLGGERTIHNRLNVLITKGFIKFNKEEKEFAGSKYGVMCVEGMEIPAGEGVDPETGETICLMRRLLPTHFKESQTGAILPVENPEVWVYVV